MKEINISDEASRAAKWLVKNQSLLTEYAVNFISAAVLLITGLILARIISATLDRVLSRRGIDLTVSGFLAVMVRYTIVAFTGIAVLGCLGVQTTSVIAVMGAAGLAVGLALQGSLSNFAAGVLLVSLRPLRAGEFVDVGGVAGTVDRVNIFSTTLRTPDNKIIIVPNGKIIAGDIINFSREPQRRVDITVSVAWSANIELVKHVLSDVVMADTRIIQENGITVRLNEIAPPALNFVVRCWTDTALYWDVWFDLTEAIKRGLDESAIPAPRPQMDVSIKSGYVS
ncbi:small-conductance mechanosensitive channel MscS [Lelliottia sp. SL45]|uniref:small-conductance mechanosensitive channel MscS n=1 Tax=Lelliottia sp. SL45 TaxID=2994665 RepID=UPI002273171A|nr:small-conductance mechanosensitive channel MscS [Lelliottia sp. SL45]MCY1700975.1 small-conductance mechanosensitive channel MscS [Lelliottia sp. SL45]